MDSMPLTLDVALIIQEDANQLENVPPTSGPLRSLSKNRGNLRLGSESMRSPGAPTNPPYDSNDSLTMGSFTAVSQSPIPENEHLEKIINFLHKASIVEVLDERSRQLDEIRVLPLQPPLPPFLGNRQGMSTIEECYESLSSSSSCSAIPHASAGITTMDSMPHLVNDHPSTTNNSDNSNKLSVDNNVPVVSATSFMIELNALIANILKVYKDPSFLRILKSFGWNSHNNRFSATIATSKKSELRDDMFDMPAFLQAVTNMYLKLKYRTSALKNDYNNKGDSIFRTSNQQEVNERLEKMSAFTPDFVVECVCRNPDNFFGSFGRPIDYSFVGACMLVDISGFSKFSASMCSKGVEGLDELRKITSGLLGQFVKAVYEHEGDVVAFAGDALICVFYDDKNCFDQSIHENNDDPSLLGQSKTSPVPHPHKLNSFNRRKVDASFRALHCANLLRSVQLTSLSTHIGISYGEMAVAFLGGYNNQWSYLLNGKCLFDLASCVEEAASQTVVCTADCYERLQFIARESDQHRSIVDTDNTDLLGSELDRVGVMKKLRMNTQGMIEYPLMRFSKIGSHGNFKLDYLPESMDINRLLNAAGRSGFVEAVLLASTPAKPDSKFGTPNSAIGKVSSPPMVSTLSKKSLKSMGIHRVSIEDLRDALETEEQERRMKVIDALTLFVPVPVVSVLQNENSNQLGELRVVTTMFLNLDSYNSNDHAKPSSLQPFFAAVQIAIAETGGYLRQFLVDDKGCVVIAMWGMPSHTYANNCSRALFAAVTIQKKITPIDLKCSIGITTGTVFCGTIGAVERCDYVGIGSEVNLAARLMSKAKGGNIFLDESTYLNLNQNNKLFFVLGKELQLKGMPHPIRPYVYTDQTEENDQSATDVGHAESVKERRHQELTLAEFDSNCYKHSSHKLIKKKVMNILERQLDKISSNSRAGSNVTTLSQSLMGSGGSMKQIAIARTPRAKGKRNHYDFRPNSVNVTILCGQPGAGKSTSVEYFRLSARERGITVVHIKAQTFHRNSPYGVIKEIFLNLIGEDNFKTAEQQNAVLIRLINQAYRDTVQDQYSPQDKAFAKHSLEILLGLNCVPKSKEHGIQPDSGDDEHVPFFRGNSKESAQESPSTKPQPGIRKKRSHSQFDNLDNDEWDTFHAESNHQPRSRDDYSFYKVLTVLLCNEPLALIIENAHYCDELSWNELLLMLLGYDIDIGMLLTMRSYHTLSKHQQQRRSGSFTASASTSNAYISNVNSNSNSFLLTDAQNANHFPFRLRTMSSLQGIPNYQSRLSESDVHMEGEDDNASITVMDLFQKNGLSYIEFASFRTIATHHNCIVYELKSLNEDEVKARVVHQLNIDTISNELVRLISDVSSGNPYWVDMISQFIKEHGISQFENAVDSSLLQRSGGRNHHKLRRSKESSGEEQSSPTENSENASAALIVVDKTESVGPRHRSRYHHAPQQSLKVLILCRFERLPPDMQKILKYASVSGIEFTANMMEFLIPSISSSTTSTRTGTSTTTTTPTTTSTSTDDAVLTPLNISSSSVMASLEYLEKHGFITWISEYPTIVYAFRNDLIQRTIYELLPPSDASKIHILVAQYIEQEFSTVLRSFYPSLAHHYRQGNNKAKAFKYELKAAALVVSSGAYQDGFQLAERSLHLAEHGLELDALVEVIDKAIEDLQQIVLPQIDQDLIMSHLMNGSSDPYSPNRAPDRDSIDAADSCSSVDDQNWSPTQLNSSAAMRKLSNTVYSLATAKNNASIVSCGGGSSDVSDRSSETLEEKIRLSASFISHSNDSHAQSLQSFRKMKCQVQLAQRLVTTGRYAVASAVSSSLSANLQWDESDNSTEVDAWLESLGVNPASSCPVIGSNSSANPNQSTVTNSDEPTSSSGACSPSPPGSSTPMSPFSAAARAELMKANTINKLSWKPSFEDFSTEFSTVVEPACDQDVAHVLARSTSSTASGHEPVELPNENVESSDSSKIYSTSEPPAAAQSHAQCQCGCIIT